MKHLIVFGFTENIKYQVFDWLRCEDCVEIECVHLLSTDFDNLRNVSDCDTKRVIVKNVPHSFNFEDVLNLVTEGFEVETNQRIHPQFAFVTSPKQIKDEWICRSIVERFDFVDAIYASFMRLPF